MKKFKIRRTGTHPSHSGEVTSKDQQIESGMHSVDPSAELVLNRTDLMYEPSRYLIILMANSLQSFLEDTKLYSLREDKLEHWPEAIQSNGDESVLSPTFVEELSSIMEDKVVKWPEL